MRPPQSVVTLIARHGRGLQDQHPYTPPEIEAQLHELPGWRYDEQALERTFTFRDYYETIAFVNAIAWMAHHEDHHPLLVVGFNRCTVRWDTHAVAGVSIRDFIGAAKTDAIFGRTTLPS